MSTPEIDIQEIKSRIEQAVARRHASGQTSFINASAKLLELLSREVPSLEASAAVPDLESFRSQPEFVTSSDDHYHISDLLKYHDTEFIWNAYRALLKREPDSQGFEAYLERLRSGRFNKIDVLASLQRSPEGRRANVQVDGLALPGMIRRLYRLPVVGYFLELAVGIARLPLVIRNQRESEGYLIGQQARLAEYVNQTNAKFRGSFATIIQAHADLRESFARLAEEQKAIARAQHQQLAAIFREQQRALRNGNVSRSQTGDREMVIDKVYAELEDQFRGSPEEIKQGLKSYLPLLKESGINSEILDLGCGRGEWLELLSDEGFEARGVESNRVMIERRRDRQLEIVEAEAVSYLRSLPENSLRAVTAFHFVEHLGFEEIVDLLDEIYRVLKPGGLLIVETPNPKNLVVGACNFYSDPTHRRPLFPETLQFIFDHRGFVQTEIQYLHAVEGSPFNVGDKAAQALNSWFFSPRDYAVIAQKPGGIRNPANILLDESAASGESQVPRETELRGAELAPVVSPTGLKFYARPGTDDERIFRDVVDRNEYSLPSKLGAEDVVLDVGAHIGSFSFAALERGAGKVYAYEAHPANSAIARKNLERFGDRAVCRNLAVWRSDLPSQTLFNDSMENGSNPNTGGHAVVYNNEGLPIQTIGLDEIIVEASDGLKKPVRLLKIDVEGAEYAILFTSKHLNIIEEICGEYHNVDPRIMPDRAKVKGVPEKFDGDALKEFFKAAGWLAEMGPNPDNPNLGHFRARHAPAKEK